MTRPVVAYYIGKSPSQFAFGGKAVNPIAVGIATRKGDALTARDEEGRREPLRERHDDEDPREVEDVQHGAQALIADHALRSHLRLACRSSSTCCSRTARPGMRCSPRSGSRCFAQTFGVIFGLISALAQMSKLRVLRFLAGVYVWFFRGTPVIVQVFFVYFGANLFLGFDLFPRTVDLGVLHGRRCRGGGHGRPRDQRGRLHERDHPRRHRLGRSRADGGGEVGRHVAVRSRCAGSCCRRPRASSCRRSATSSTTCSRRPRCSPSSACASCSRTPTSATRRRFKPVEYFSGVAVLYLLLTTIWGFIQSADRAQARAQRPRARAGHVAGMAPLRRLASASADDASHRATSDPCDAASTCTSASAGSRC